ncbi:PiggyBac transposable element-derived protein [Cinara cedri]|uniref:PiggyBac transposable element-derived protein n=1 Tax=Cinara cedri TaxID=506608 RepID=A0A5E4MMC9_9HEMI|nr:PiggyBac transposable element-derived protein [Cinara cedri]
MANVRRGTDRIKSLFNMVIKVHGHVPKSQSPHTKHTWFSVIDYSFSIRNARTRLHQLDDCRESVIGSMMKKQKKADEIPQKLLLKVLIFFKPVLIFIFFNGRKSGAIKSGHRSTNDLWTLDGFGADILACVMSEKRAKKIDNMTAIRKIFEDFVKNCNSCYKILEYAAIDEELQSFRGRCSFRVYMPNKPAKYGLKLFALVDSVNYYTNDCASQYEKQTYLPSAIRLVSSDSPDFPLLMKYGANLLALLDTANKCLRFCKCSLIFFIYPPCSIENIDLH